MLRWPDEHARVATLNDILDHDLQANAEAVGRRIRQRLSEAAAGLPRVGDVRGKGLMIGVELVEPGTTRPLAEAASALFQQAKEHGLLVGEGGLYGNVLRISPPMAITGADAQDGTERLVAALSTVDHQMRGSNR